MFHQSSKSKLHFHRLEFKKLIILALPAIMTQLAFSGLGVIDTIMAGQHGPQTLAAIAIGTNIYIPIMVFVTGTLLVLNPMLAQLNGAADHQQLCTVFQHGILLSLILFIPGVLMLLNAEWLLIFVGSDPNTIPLTIDYLNALCWGLPCLFVFFALRFTNEGLFNTKIVMLITLGSLPLNVLVNYWFIYGGLGLAPMGAVGVGWATSVVNTYMCAVLLFETIRNPAFQPLGLFKNWSFPQWSIFHNLLKLGIPMGISIGLEVGLFAATGLLVSAYTINEIAAHQIAISITSMCYMLPLGLSMAITARVGFHIGANDPYRAKIAGWSGIGLALMITGCLSIMLLLLGEQIVSLYTREYDVIKIATGLLIFGAMFQLSDGIQVASIGALRGLKDTKIPMYFNGFAFWFVGLPVGIYLAERQQFGIDGYWIALLVGLSIAALLMLVRFKWLTYLPHSSPVTTATGHTLK